MENEIEEWIEQKHARFVREIELGNIKLDAIMRKCKESHMILFGKAYHWNEEPKLNASKKSNKVPPKKRKYVLYFKGYQFQSK